MSKIAVIILTLASAALGQTTTGAKPATPPQNKAPQASKSAEIPPTAAVITLAGFCPNSAGAKDTKSPDCKTVVTRAEFETLVDALNPNMQPNARQSLAAEYARMLVFSDIARQRGLENSPHFNDLLKFVRMQVMAQELLRNMQEKSKPSAEDVQKYYAANQQKYEEISLKRLFIPRNRPDAKAEDKKPTDEELQAEGEKYRTQLAAGADFDKLQKEVYESKGYKTPPPPTTIPNWRRDSIPPNQIQLFDLKAGELSKVMVEGAGAYIYRLQEKKVIPLDTVKREIEATIANQNLRKEMESVTSSIKPEFNQAYFSAGSEDQHAIPGANPPQGAPSGATPQPK